MPNSAMADKIVSINFTGWVISVATYAFLNETAMGCSPPTGTLPDDRETGFQYSAVAIFFFTVYTNIC